MIAVKLKSGTKFDLYTLEDGGCCDLVEFLTLVRNTAPVEFNKLVKDLDRIADIGLIGNPDKFRVLDGDIYELRTYGGIQVLCYFEGDRMVILTAEFKRMKERGSNILKSINLKVKYLAALASNSLDFRDESYE